VGWNLTASAAGAVVRVQLPPESAVRGPVNGQIAVAADDGIGSKIQLLDPQAGCASVVYQTTDVVRSAILVPGDDSVVFHSVGRADRADRGIWRLPLHAGRAPVPVLPPLAPSDSFLAPVGRVWTTTLRSSPQGRQVAVESCGADACRTRIVSLGDAGPEMLVSEAAGHVVGLDEQLVVSLDSCDGQRCELLTTNLASGQVRSLMSGATSAASTVVAGRQVAVAVSAELGPESVLAIDPETGRRWVVRGAVGPATGDRELNRGRNQAAPGELQLLPRGGDGLAGLEVSVGSVAAIRSPGGIPVALDVAAAVDLAGDGAEATR
jgi:hypothetical protein